MFGCFFLRFLDLIFGVYGINKSTDIRIRSSAESIVSSHQSYFSVEDCIFSQKKIEKENGLIYISDADSVYIAKNSFFKCVSTNQRAGGIFRIFGVVNTTFYCTCVEKCFSLSNFFLFYDNTKNGTISINLTTIHSCPLDDSSLCFDCMSVKSVTTMVYYINFTKIDTSCFGWDTSFNINFGVFKAYSEENFSMAFWYARTHSNSFLIQFMPQTSISNCQYGNIVNCSNGEDFPIFLICNNTFLSNLYVAYTASPLASFYGPYMLYLSNCVFETVFEMNNQSYELFNCSIGPSKLIMIDFLGDMNCAFLDIEDSLLDLIIGGFSAFFLISIGLIVGNYLFTKYKEKNNEIHNINIILETEKRLDLDFG